MQGYRLVVGWIMVNERLVSDAQQVAVRILPQNALQRRNGALVARMASQAPDCLATHARVAVLKRHLDQKVGKVGHEGTGLATLAEQRMHGGAAHRGYRVVECRMAQRIDAGIGAVVVEKVGT